MPDEFKQYRNRIVARYGVSKKQAIARLLSRELPDWRDQPEWAQKLLFLPTVSAKQHSQTFRVSGRTGTLAQPGRRKLHLETDVYHGQPGDYEVQVDTETVAVRRTLFETLYEPLE